MQLQRLYVVSGQLDNLHALNDSLQNLGLQKNNLEWEGMGQHGMGRHAEHSNKPEEAIVHFKKALQLLETARKPGRMALCYLSLSALEYRAGHTDTALKMLDDAVARLDPATHQSELCKVYQYRGTIMYNTGQYLQSIQYNQLAEESCGAAGENRVLASALLNTGNIFIVLKMPELAKPNLIRAAEILTSLNESRSAALANSALIFCSDNMQEAGTYFQKGMQMAENPKFRDVTTSLLYNYGQFLADSLQDDTALKYLQQSLDYSIEAKNENSRVNATRVIAQIYLNKGFPKKAIHLCSEVLEQARKSNRQDQLLGFYKTLAGAYEQLGKLDSAVYYLNLHIQKSDELQKDKNTAEAVRYFLTYRNEREKELSELQQKQVVQEKEAQLSRTRLLTWFLLVIILALSALSMIIFRFYSYKKRAEEILLSTNKLLESERETLASNNARLKRFASVVSHDILSNIDLILSSGNVLVNPQSGREQLQQYHQITQQTSRQLKTYCLGLLEETIKEKHSNQTYNPMPAVQNVLTSLGPSLRSANFQIELGELSPAPLPPVVTEQLFQNLLTNVLRYAANNPAPHIRIAEEKDSDGHTIWVVEDNGPGISSTLRNTVFEGAANGESKGQGVGLSLLRSSLREYGVEIRIEERRGGGARFVIDLQQKV